jgi:hypothetical protein
MACPGSLIVAINQSIQIEQGLLAFHTLVLSFGNMDQDQHEQHRCMWASAEPSDIQWQISSVFEMLMDSDWERIFDIALLFDLLIDLIEFAGSRWVLFCLSVSGAFNLIVTL